MKHFSHMQAGSAEEAASNVAVTFQSTGVEGSAMFIAGGTDLLGTLKDELLPTYPQLVIDLKTIAGLDQIEDEGSQIRIGALVKLADVAASEVVQQGAAALAKACSRVASPTIRHMGTIGGNICQMHRCWYFRVPDDRFHCKRKGGNYCPARIGDNRYHSIFGDECGCFAASSQDSAPALIALGATMVTTKRELSAEDFFHINGVRSCALDEDEMLTHIIVPKAAKSSFRKFALRKSIDFPVVNCAVAQTEDGSVKVALGGVYPSPIRSAAAEEAVAAGVTEESAAAAGDAAVKDAKPLPKNEYKVEITRMIVKRTLLEIAG